MAKGENVNRKHILKAVWLSTLLLKQRELVPELKNYLFLVQR